MPLEKSWGLRTIPLVYGIRIAKFSGILALTLNSFLHLIMYSESYFSFDILIALLLSSLVAAVLVLFTRKEPSDWFCKFYVDGMMFLQFLFVFLAK